MKYYNVSFTFNIPVEVRDEDEEVDIYYAAREQFAQYRVNEANVKITKIDQQHYQKEKKVIEKLHNEQY